MVAVPRGAARHAAYCVVFRRATKQWDSANRALNKFAYALSVLMSKLRERTVRIDVAKYSKTDRVVNATYNLSYAMLSTSLQLHVAACNGYVVVGEFLLNRRVGVSPVDNDSWMPIHHAALWKQVGRFPCLSFKLYLITLTASSSKRNITVWRLSVCLSVPSA